MSPRTGTRRRRFPSPSIRASLITLALVPGVTLTALWGVTTTQMISEGLRLRDQTELSRSTGAMGTETTLALQQERSLSAVWLATPNGSRAELDAQRRRTDKVVGQLVARTKDIQQAPARIRDRMYTVVASLGSLEYYRGQVDNPSDITAGQALGQYTSIIDDQIHAFRELSQVDDGDLTSQAGPLIALEHAAELISEEDLWLTLAGPSGEMDDKTWAKFAELVNTQRWLVRDQITPALTGDAKTETEHILNSPQWRTLESIEDTVLAARSKAGGGGSVRLPDVQKEWRAALIHVSDEYTKLIRQQIGALLDRSSLESHVLLFKAGSMSAAGLVALLACVVVSWRITRSLSRRLRGLRMATLSLAHERLPEVVARLDRGETVDVDSATPPLDYGADELGQVAAAFNTAQRTAVHTAVELADTRRGFEKVILGIARQSQNLVNLQLSKLDALERSHQDPDILKGLYELDSAASQLRRYEENLVIISGGRPGRTWSEPVALIDVLRSAVGEVAEYRRVEVRSEDEVCVVPPAVADLTHLLAELIDNATSYSPPPSPVEVRAALVPGGLSIEVEDRGLGMHEEDYTSFNAQLAVEPQFDVVALADDLRLGMFVIARLATRHGISVTLRPSPHDGTTATVLVPDTVVVPAETDAGTGAGSVAADGPGAARGLGAEEVRAEEVRGDADRTRKTVDGMHSTSDRARATADGIRDMADKIPDAADGTPNTADGSRDTADRTHNTARVAPTSPPPAPRPDGLAPLPRRVPKAGRDPRQRQEHGPAEPGPPAGPPHSAPDSPPGPSLGAPPEATPDNANDVSPDAVPSAFPHDLAGDFTDDFSAERAASSLAGFQRGTLRAREGDGQSSGPPVSAAGPPSQTSAPPADST